MKRIYALCVALVSLIAITVVASPYLPNPPWVSGANRSPNPPLSYIYDAQGNLIGTGAITGVDTYFGSNVTSPVKPLIASGFGFSTGEIASGVSIANASGVQVIAGTNPATFSVATSGAVAGGTLGVLTMPLAPNGWTCSATDISQPTTLVIAPASRTPTSVTMNVFSRTTGLAASSVAADKIDFQCNAY